VEHRHLLPDEIDLLVDGEEGFGVAPLRGHVEQCAACRAELEAQQRLVSRLEQLPYHSPAPLFNARVMSKVRVFEPWHVAALNTVDRVIPRSRPARVAAGATAGAMALLLTLGTVWIATRINGIVFLATVALERARASSTQVLNGFAQSVLGDAGASGLVSGPLGVTVAVGALLIAILGVAFGFQRLAAVSRRRRM
jgi:hypothetical protein